MDTSVFIHEKDKKALDALKAVPGFAVLMKQFMKVFSDRLQTIEFLSSGIRLSENQMPEIYELLGPICEKLEIEKPDLYLILDRDPNAFTLGENHPAIVLTSGLLETLSRKQIEGVIAHECGHIACHHVLYLTIAKVLASASTLILSSGGIGKLVSIPITLALQYWCRCSELSADRAAAYYFGDAQPVADLMATLSGATSNLLSKLNYEEYLKQAKEYEDYVKSSDLNKAIEFLLYADMDHPLNVTRAKEVLNWMESEQFQKLMEPKE